MQIRRDSALGALGLKKESVAQEGALSLGLRRPSEGFVIYIVMEFSREISLTQKIIVAPSLSDLSHLHNCESLSLLKSFFRSRSTGYFEKALRRVGSAEAFSCHWGTSE